MKIGQKITIGFLVVVVIFATFGYSIYSNEKSIEAVTSHFSDEIIIELNTLQELKSSSLRVLSSTMEIVLIMDERNFMEQQQQQQQQIENELEIEKKEILQGIKNFENAFDILNDLTIGDPFEVENTNNVKEKWNAFLRTTEELIEAKESGISGSEILELKEKLEQEEIDLLKLIDGALEHEFDEVIAQGIIIDSSFSTNSQIILWGVISIVIASIIIGLGISRSISKPITKLKLAADLVRQGQFDFQIDSIIKKSNDEIGELAKSFDDMAKSIQEKIELERKLAASEEKIKNERLTAIGNLSSRLAHDLRNPLSVISTDFSIMKKKHPELDKDSVERIERGIGRIDHQVQSVLNFIKLKPSRLKNHSALELLKDVLGSMSIKKDIKINLPDNNSQILCDKEQCEILFYNIIFNAVQELEEKGGTISIRIIEQDDFVIIEFEDSGEGIPKENLDQIFDPLFTTKQSGTGLGLASCKNIMEQFRGKISVELNPTIFTLVFPRKINTKQNYL